MLRLGRLPHDPAKLAAAPSLRLAAEPPPPRLEREHVDVKLGMYGNDEFPDCTAAGAFNYVSALAGLSGYGLVIDPECAPAFYAECVGCADTSEAIAATDGAVLIDVIERMGRNGLNIGSQELVGFGGTIPLSRSALALSLAKFGAGYWGVDLYDADMQTVGGKWDTDRDPGGIVGGHCVVGFSYTGLADEDVVRIATWGAWQPATWLWVEDRIREAHGLVFRDLMYCAGWTDASYETLRAECA